MFIYNFARLIDWPIEYKTGDFIIGIYGNSEVERELGVFTTGKKAGVQTIKIEQYKSLDEIGKCHILFISYGKSRDIEEIINKIGTAPTLIIGEKRGLVEDGAAINFVIVANKLKFELSVANASRNQLKVSNSLQQMAIIK
jgi:hypothetical protein